VEVHVVYICNYLLHYHRIILVLTSVENCMSCPSFTCIDPNQSVVLHHAVQSLRGYWLCCADVLPTACCRMICVPRSADSCCTCMLIVTHKKLWLLSSMLGSGRKFHR